MSTPWAAILLVIALFPAATVSGAEEGVKRSIVHRIDFSALELPQNLYSAFTGQYANSFLEYRLPADYSPDKQYPLIVYVPGFHGHAGGNLRNAIDIAGANDCVVASLPLFKTRIDPTEVAQGVILGFSDYSVLANAYEIMFTRLFQQVPNIDYTRSALVGFSNGAIAVAVLVSLNNDYILTHFQHFCLVDHGMFHLSDLHKSPTRDRRFLVLVGDQPDIGRELKLRGAQLLEDTFGSIGVDIEHRILVNTGHELTKASKQLIGAWLFGETAPGSEEPES